MRGWIARGEDEPFLERFARLGDATETKLQLRQPRPGETKRAVHFCRALRGRERTG